MTLFRFTPQAEADLFQIWSYIASDNPEAAERVKNAIYETCGFLSDGPTRGQTRKDLTVRPLRFWTCRSTRTTSLVTIPELHLDRSSVFCMAGAT
jgi:plasmid stabilization system protein ParE